MMQPFELYPIETQDQMSFYLFVLYEISVLIKPKSHDVDVSTI